LTFLSLFRLELHRGLKTVDVDPQRPIEFGELAVGRLAREAIITDEPFGRFARSSALRSTDRCFVEDALS
jgi:hypothetical protein